MPTPQLEPDFDWKQELKINGISDLNDHLDYVIEKIFDFENSFTHNLKLVDKDKLAIEFHHYSNSYKDKSMVQFQIKTKDDNPLKKMGGNDYIRVKETK